MSQKERDRKVFLEQVKQGYFTLKEASIRMQVSYRQAKRIYQQYRQKGDAGLVHQRRGCLSNRAFSDEFKQKILKEYRTHYEGFGPTLAAEKLEKEGYKIHHDTLRKWLLKAGLWQLQRCQPKHRQRRPRKAKFGELVQMDGSIHRWFGENQPFHCLMNMVDDATGRTFSLMAIGETTQAAMEALKKWIDCYGIPKALYVDLKSLYVGKLKLTDEELVKIEKAFCVFAKVCYRLGIEIKKAYSAEAKGRVERNHQVYQDRLVKEIKLEKLTTVEEVNQLLHSGFIDDLNKRFAKAATDTEDAHRPVPKDWDLENIFCWETTRQVQNDWTVRYQNAWYQVKKMEPLFIKSGDKVIIKTHLNGTISLWFKDKKLPFEKIGKDKPVPEKQEKLLLSEMERSVVSRKNSAISPWRAFNPGWLKQQNRATTLHP